MLHFLENHDEQRIANPEFVGDAERGKPAMVVSALIGSSPTMLYFGQEVGEAAKRDAGFGTASRTTIFDYWGVPAHQRWMNGGKFDGGALSEDEMALRDFYVRLLNISASDPTMRGDYAPITVGDDRVFAFARWTGEEQLFVVSNFDNETRELMVDIPAKLMEQMGLGASRHELVDQLSGSENAITIDHGIGKIRARLKPFESFAWRVGDDVRRNPSSPREERSR
jgi:glycosidase